MLIPAYNAEATIVNTVESVLRQKYSPSQIIVYNDGSTDETAAVLDRYRDKCKIIDNTDNFGVGVARKRLIAESSSSWILILDADDALVGNASELLTQAVAQYPKLQVVGFAEKKLGQEQGGPSPTLRSSPTYDSIWQKNPFVSSATLISRESVLVAGGFSSQRRLVDYDLWLRMFRDGSTRGAVFNEPLVLRTISADTITGNVVAAVAEQKRLIDRELTVAGGIRVSRHRMVKRSLELWARGYVRHLKYGKSPGEYLPMDKIYTAPLLSVLDRMVRNNLVGNQVLRILSIREKREQTPQENRGINLFVDFNGNRKRPTIQVVLALFRLARSVRGKKRGRLRSMLALPLIALYRMVSMSVAGIDLPVGTVVGPRLSIHHGFGLVVNKNCRLGSDITLRHGTTLGSRYSSTDCPTLGDRVELGANVTILGSVVIGADAVVGAGSVVLIDVPAMATAAGNPARIVRRSAGAED
ncbi:glycosyltransferase [Williamsia sp. 1135]|uniref:glycosyltransferase n=1 Tax=Williamsia sp. 1135 TaxID=1889262 RepID=UPI00143B8409|nr:glycosyltransferase [Williamsia sp. 1135]